MRVWHIATENNAATAEPNVQDNAARRKNDSELMMFSPSMPE
jgi:hypothetical protein